MLLKVAGNIDEILKVLKDNGFDDAKEVFWQDEFIQSEIEYRVENDSKGYSDEVIKETSRIFFEELNENIDDTAIDNEYLSSRWKTLLDEVNNGNL